MRRRVLSFSLAGPVLLATLIASGCRNDSSATPFLGTGSGTDGGDPNNECVGTQCPEAPGTGLGGAGANPIGTGGLPGLIEFECPSPGSGQSLDVALLPVEAPGATLKLHLNHVGYDSKGAKTAVVEADTELTKFQLVSVADQIVHFEGELGDEISFPEFGGSSHHYVADFSALQTEGEFELRVNGEVSPPFVIESGRLFDATVSDVLDFFRKSRADDANVWSADSSVPLFGGGGSRDVRGGWYDASGDLSKYLSHLSYANFMNPQQIPMTVWALSHAHDSAIELFRSRGLDAALLEEAVWGADYLVRAQSPEGFFYINVFDGWSGNMSDREICAFEGSSGQKTGDYRAAYREGGGVSIAALARLAAAGHGGDFSAEEYLAAAELGFAHLEQNNLSYADDGKENVIDDYTALLAASELFAATAKAEYLSAAAVRAENLAKRLSDQGYFIADDGDRPFFHAAEAGLPILALTRYSELETDDAKREATLQVVARHLTYLVQVTEQTANPFGYARQHFKTGGAVRSGFFIPHDNETGYWWQGESARQASLAAAALIGGRALAGQDCGVGVGPELAGFAADQLDWILGKNPYDISMMAGHGRNNPPTYCSVKSQEHGHHDGGISNGITGARTDGSGIQWRSPQATGDDCWQDWRWVEQWLPHSTWFLVAATALAQAE